MGFIFAGLLGRKPICPGTECRNQLKLIVNVLGTISEADLGSIDKTKARKYINSLPYSSGIPILALYPHANPLAVDLIQKILIFLSI
ncbi:mitogen-activated protein kinase 4-like [Iris pallida]|uniref:Mitogen-activated protein kinase 4-like n=1 Tax=Iris pallida TaxID=29817 RepID=A0AAX6FZ67_IRIPA|nr:mitogen-activated protein kinase 4-like [Iris pallida]